MNEAEKFKEFLAESFREGVYIRELRLSMEETEFIKKFYPMASLNKAIPKKAPDGKMWYRVSLQPPENEREWIQVEKITDIQKENLLLKQELEALKKRMNDRTAT